MTLKWVFWLTDKSNEGHWGTHTFSTLEHVSNHIVQQVSYQLKDEASLCWFSIIQFTIIALLFYYAELYTLILTIFHYYNIISWYQKSVGVSNPGQAIYQYAIYREPSWTPSRDIVMTASSLPLTEIVGIASINEYRNLLKSRIASLTENQQLRTFGLIMCKFPVK